MSGKVVPSRTLENLYDGRHDQCRTKCCTKITKEQQRIIFDRFYGLGDFDVQNGFIRECISVCEITRKRNRVNPAESRRSGSRTFVFVIPSGQVRVCKKFFLKTLCVSNGRVARVMKKAANASDKAGIPSPDKRGSGGGHNKIPADRIALIKEHISIFLINESHYTRSHQATRKYLSSDLTVTKMYRLYKVWMETKGYEPLQEWVYRRVFVTDFNLSFHQPRQDTCKTCDSLKIKIEACEIDAEKNALKAELEIHHRRAENVRQSLRSEKEKAQQNPQYHAFTFDLEKTLPTPHLPTGIVYYKRQLWTYNLGIHSMKDERAQMFMWHEGIAKRGANEIGSCLYKYIKSQESHGINELSAYSDACGGQNRNIKIALFWSYIVASTSITRIDHKFMVSGHSYLPNDRDFGVIERKRKVSSHVYVPEDWMEIVATARSQGSPFEVIKMTPEDFRDSLPLAKYTVNRKKTVLGEDVKWL